MARRKKRRTIRRTSRKINVLWLFFIVISGIILIGGSVWIYKMLSQREKPSFPKTEVSKKITREVNLYFASQDAKKLVPEKREILVQPNSIKEIRMVVDELIQGPRNKNLVRTLPPQAKLRSLYVDFNEAVAYIDFNENIAKYSPGGSAGEILSVYSVVNSVTENFSEVKRVKILINGEEVQTLVGHIDLTQPIGFSQGIIKGR